MGNEASNFSQLCGAQGSAEAQRYANTQSLKQKQKPKSKSKKKPKKAKSKSHSKSSSSLTSYDYNQREDHNPTNDEYTLEPQNSLLQGMTGGGEFEYMQDRIDELEQQLKTEQRESSRIITGYNLTIESKARKHKQLQQKYDTETEQNNVLLQQLQVLFLLIP